MSSSEERIRPFCIASVSKMQAANKMIPKGHSVEKSIVQEFSLLSVTPNETMLDFFLSFCLTPGKHLTLPLDAFLNVYGGIR